MDPRHIAERGKGGETETVRNLKGAILQIENELIDKYGIKAISAIEEARAKAPLGEPRPEHITVMIEDDDIVSISLVTLALLPWKYVPMTPDEIQIICWKEQGNHLSGPADAATLAVRIQYALENLGAQADGDLPI